MIDFTGLFTLENDATGSGNTSGCEDVEEETIDHQRDVFPFFLNLFDQRRKSLRLHLFSRDRTDLFLFILLSHVCGDTFQSVECFFDFVRIQRRIAALFGFQFVVDLAIDFVTVDDAKRCASAMWNIRLWSRMRRAAGRRFRRSRIRKDRRMKLYWFEQFRPAHPKKFRENLEKDASNPRRHLMSQRRTKMNVQHDDGDDDR